jgi:tetratricopeptide (TPR) repeat protein
VLREGLSKAAPGVLVAWLLDPSRWFFVVRDSATLAVLGQLTVRDFGGDSGLYYLQRAGWSRQRGELTRARGYSDSARRALEAQLQRHPENAWRRSGLGLAYAGLGRREDAMREARRAVELMPLSKDATDGPEVYFGLALVAVLVGDHETAIDQLELLLSVPSSVSVPWLRVAPTWDPLRSNPRFKRLLQSEGRPAA